MSLPAAQVYKNSNEMRRKNKVTMKNLGISVSSEKLKEATNLYLEQKGLNMHGLHDITSSEDESKASRSSCESVTRGHNIKMCKYGAKDLKARVKQDWQKRIMHFRKVENRQESKVTDDTMTQDDLKAIYPHMHGKSTNNLGDGRPDIFSAENYQRIVDDHLRATKQKNPKLMNKIIQSQDENPTDFFYQYKQMSVSAANLYKVGKSPDQLQEDKAVQIFFRKQLQKTKDAIHKYNHNSPETRS